jgi:phosphate starvation-inducible PhoH-like protein
VTEKLRSTRSRGARAAARAAASKDAPATAASAAALAPPSAAPARAGGGAKTVLQFAAGNDNLRLAHLAGALDGNLRQIENEFAVRIRRRGGQFRIEGAPQAARDVQALLERLHAQAQRPVTLEDVQLQVFEQKRSAPGARTARRGERSAAGGSFLAAADSSADAFAHASGDAAAEPGHAVLRTRRPELHARTPVQAQYLQSMLAHDISFGIGPAGTGKTYLAVACAADALERDAVERIVLTRPAVEAGERLGFLPGDLAQKVDPYLRPLYDALFDLVGFDKTQRLLERQAIEIAPLAYMRGRTLNHSFVILDEAQNTTPEQMKMFLTRIGFGSKAVITGDVTQTDLPRGSASGLIEAQHVLHDVRGIGFTYFTAADVVRHPLVARIVEAYERASALATPKK